MSRYHLLAEAARLSGGFHLSASAGAGYTRLTDLYGDDVYIDDDFARWDSSSLLVMRQVLTREQADDLERWGLKDAFETIRSLDVGDAILLER